MGKVEVGADRRKRHARVRIKVNGTSSKARLCVFRSLKHIYAQIIDDGHKQNTVAGITKFSFSSQHLKDASGDKKAIAKQVGLELGKLAVAGSVTEVFFDRGPYRYHGRVRALAEGLRESGLKF